MIIKTKITEKEFTTANLVLFYKKTSIRILNIVLLSVLFLFICIYIKNPMLPSGIIFFLSFYLLSLPLLIYYRAKKVYRLNDSFSEVTEYHFEAENFSVHAETYNVQLNWKKVYKVIQTKKWLFIWQSNQFARIIPNKDITEDFFPFLKTILNNHKIPHNL